MDQTMIWIDNWRLRLNIDKIEAIIFGRRQKKTSSKNKNKKPSSQMEKPNKISRRHDGHKTDNKWTLKNYYTKSKRSRSLILPNTEPKFPDSTKDQNPTVHHLHQTNYPVRISCLSFPT